MVGPPKCKPNHREFFLLVLIDTDVIPADKAGILAIRITGNKPQAAEKHLRRWWRSLRGGVEHGLKIKEVAPRSVDTVHPQRGWRCSFLALVLVRREYINWASLIKNEFRNGSNAFLSLLSFPTMPQMENGHSAKQYICFLMVQCKQASLGAPKSLKYCIKSPSGHEYAVYIKHEGVLFYA